jgi:hypothetical protein
LRDLPVSFDLPNRLRVELAGRIGSRQLGRQKGFRLRDLSALCQEIEEWPDARWEWSALANVDGMEGFPVAGVQVFQHGHEAAGGNVVSHCKGGKAQLRQNLGAVGWALSPEQIAKLDRASAVTAPYPHFPYRVQEAFARIIPAGQSLDSLVCGFRPVFSLACAQPPHQPCALIPTALRQHFVRLVLIHQSNGCRLARRSHLFASERYRAHVRGNPTRWNCCDSVWSDDALEWTKPSGERERKPARRSLSADRRILSA